MIYRSDGETQYLNESIRQVLDDNGIKYNDDQISDLVYEIIGIFEVKSEYLGHNLIENPLQTEIDNLHKKYKEEIKNLKNQLGLVESVVLQSNGRSDDDAFIHIQDGIVKIHPRY